MSFLSRLFSWGRTKPQEPRGWPWSHRHWEGVEIPCVGIVVGWDSTPGRVLVRGEQGDFISYDLPDYPREQKT